MKVKFDLETWLKDKTQKIVTSNGREVEILSYERRDCKELIQKKEDFPIVALIKNNDEVFGDSVALYNREGKIWRTIENNDGQLYIVQDKYDLTEFKKKLKDAVLLSTCGDIDEVLDELAPGLFDTALDIFFNSGSPEQTLDPISLDEEARRASYEKYPECFAIVNGESIDTNAEFRESYISGYINAMLKINNKK